MTQSK